MHAEQPEPDRSAPHEHGELLRLTYAQIGDRLGISSDAARMLARRRGWTRQAPNRRGAPVFVLVAEQALVDEQWRTEVAEPSPNGADGATNAPDTRVNEAEARAEHALHLSGDMKW